MLETNTILNIDCLEGIPLLEDESIDGIFCDLPYGQTSRNSWDLIIPMNDYIIIDGKRYYKEDFMLKSYKDGVPYREAKEIFLENRQIGLWTHYNRIIKPNGVIVLFANGMFTADLMQSNRKMWRYNLIWEKTQPTGFLNAKKMPMRCHEDMCVFYKKLPVYNPQKTNGHIRKVSKAEHKINCKETSDYGEHGLSTYDSTERYPKSIWKFAKDSQKSALHPTQKPVALMEELIRTYTNQGDTLLDNCGGSMATAEAAINTNRKYICMEKNKEIFETGKMRIETVCQSVV